MRHVIEITRNNYPGDGDSITAEVTLDVADGTVTHVGTRVVQTFIDGMTCSRQDGPGWMYVSHEALIALERDCDPVAMAMDKLRAADLSGGVK